MNSPYKVRVRFFLDTTGAELFHQMKGVNSPFRKNDIVYLNDVKYKVKDVEMYLYDKEHTHPETVNQEWSMDEEYYKVTVQASA